MVLLKLAEKQYIAFLRQMGSTDEQIKKKMKSRVLKTVLVFLIFILLTLASKEYLLILLSLLLPILVFKLDLFAVKRAYEKFSLERELAFGQFMQLIVPYLKKEKGKDTLYMIFSKLVTRVNTSLQNALFNLMNEMVDKPNEIQPFVDFAKKSSNNDESINFMIALFDFHTSTTDVTVIEELSETANNQLFNRVDDVIKIKNQMVEKYPMVMAICMALVLIPFLLMYLVYIISSSGFL